MRKNNLLLFCQPFWARVMMFHDDQNMFFVTQKYGHRLNSGDEDRCFGAVLEMQTGVRVVLRSLEGGDVSMESSWTMSWVFSATWYQRKCRFPVNWRWLKHFCQFAYGCFKVQVLVKELFRADYTWILQIFSKNIRSGRLWNCWTLWRPAVVVFWPATHRWPNARKWICNAGLLQGGQQQLSGEFLGRSQSWATTIWIAT